MLSKLISAAVGTVLLPVAVVADVVTMAGAMTDEDRPYTATRVKQIYRDIGEALGDE